MAAAFTLGVIGASWALALGAFVVMLKKSGKAKLTPILWTLLGVMVCLTGGVLETSGMLFGVSNGSLKLLDLASIALAVAGLVCIMKGIFARHKKILK